MNQLTSGPPAQHPGRPLPAGNTGGDIGIDQMTLAGVDLGLFRCLRKLGTSRQRICSALCLSYAEYDYICRHAKEF